MEREFGDDFVFSLRLLRSRLQVCLMDDEKVSDVGEIEKQVMSIA